ncbi:ankyrin repeat-containing protein [Fusarium beomiforme]|uniref:Ankyrin repeat-containing protein n=1 Tax=Fusarium beomiforme TaxID=44412 RepID=A0A9P5AH94_9HYPO|nr:ankyrin repeat-containing protein [Fusarium beomiforme]
MFSRRKSRKQEIQDFFESSEGAFPLSAAICNDDIAKVQDLIASSPSLIESEEDRYGTPLHVSLFCDNLEALTLLLDAGADPLAASSGTDDQANALTIAGREGKQPFLHQLLKHTKLFGSSRVYKCLQYCLLESASWGQVASVANLMAWWDGWTLETKEFALRCAAQRWKVYVAEFLIANVKFEQKALDDALAYAIDYKVYMSSTNEYRIDYEGVDYFEQQQLIKLLLHAGANPNTTHFGIPLVIHTAKNGNLIGALSVLLENGANPNTADNKGRTALHHLGDAQRLRQGMFTCRVHEAGIRLLLGHKAAVILQDESGAMPIHEAAYGTNLRILLLELFTIPVDERHSALRLTNRYWTTLLHYAAAGAKLDVIEYLVSQGLDVNQANANGWTPLICAIIPTSSGFSSEGKSKSIDDAIQAAQILLDHGADPLVTTAEGWTPLHAFSLFVTRNASRRVSAMISELISRGIDSNARAIFPTATGRTHPSPPTSPWGYKYHQMIQHPDKYGIAMVRQGYTPLHFAAAKGSVGMAKALLANGADASCRDATGNSAAKIAKYTWYLEGQLEIRDEMVKLLSEANPPGK